MQMLLDLPTMLSVEFRDWATQRSMLVTTLHFIKDGDQDEILKIFRKNGDDFKCVFQPSDLRSAFSFHLNRRTLIDYVLDMIDMVAKDDVDPYEQIQVSTMIHPRILFHVSELSKEEVSERMWDMIKLSWSPAITKNGLSTNRLDRNNAHSQRVPSSQTGRYFSRPNPEDSDS